jgi:hypothetical protein
MPKDIPPCAPHDWTGEGMRYGDLRAIEPPINRFESRFQSNVSLLCEAVPLKKQAGEDAVSVDHLRPYLFLGHFPRTALFVSALLLAGVTAAS